MDFELTPQMIDKISFAMEDQEKKYLIHVETGELAAVSELGDAPRDLYVPLPRWGSAEGFHLMESFVTSLHNPVHRELLVSALTAGKGVFRTFKDNLKKNAELEKLWFHYKERRLRGVIISWYNSNREARGLEKLPPEPEETDELVATDFSLSWGIDGHAEEILALDREAFFELFPPEHADIEARFEEKRRGLLPLGEASLILVAENPAGELAGFVWGRMDGDIVHIAQIAVERELRGIGLGEALLRRFLADIRARGVRKLTTELAGKSLRFSAFFQSLGFAPLSQVLECSLDRLPF